MCYVNKEEESFNSEDDFIVFCKAIRKSMNTVFYDFFLRFVNTVFFMISSLDLLILRKRLGKIESSLIYAMLIRVNIV